MRRSNFFSEDPSEELEERIVSITVFPVVVH